MANEVSAHGGDLYGALLAGGPAPLDFSANVSPFGLPEGVRRALAARAAEFERYPDPHCRELNAALAEKHGVPRETVVCGAGSADLIFRIVRALRPARALVTAPVFSEYERALAEVDASVRRYPLAHPDFTTGSDLADFARQCAGGVVFLCNPNNPTGVLTPRETMARVLCACEAAGATLVVDECFMELTDDPGAFSAEPLLAAHKNLLVLKAFTKTYAMAGLRLGYVLCGDAETAARVVETGPPWSVSVPAQIAGLAALREKDYLKRLRALVRAEREKLRAGLANAGAEVILGSANFVFFRAWPGLAQALEARGVLIRDCSNFVGLEDGTYFRAAVRLPAENARLLREICQISVYNEADLIRRYVDMPVVYRLLEEGI